MAPKDETLKRGQREPLDSAQVIDLCKVLLQDGAPWAVVVILLQLACGERAGCIVNAKFSWLENLSPDAADAPLVRIRKVNGKTVPRTVPLQKDLAASLHSWMFVEPLRGGECFGCNSQWPFVGQKPDPECYLFPSATVQGFRNFSKPVTRHGFQARLKAAAVIIQRERAQTRRTRPADDANIPRSVWENYNLSKLGTHSFKRSSITMLKSVCTSTAVVGAIAGTSAATCDKYYDFPSHSRQVDALDRSLTRVFRSIAVEPSPVKRARSNAAGTASGGDGAGEGDGPRKSSPAKSMRSDAAGTTSGGDGAGEGDGFVKSSPAKRMRSDAAGTAKATDGQFSFCPYCGRAREDPGWQACPWCTKLYGN
jgi:hypothetical protein